MAITGQSKSSAVTLTPLVKAGAGYDYDQKGYTYDIEKDEHGRDVFYDGVGVAFSPQGQSKSSAVTLTSQTKNTI